MFIAIKGKKKVPIDYDNVYARCPQCGVLHKIDLCDIILQTKGDLDVQIYCHACSVERAKQYRGQPWAEQLIREGV